jgi:myo-inositol 2-dehydrogenase/D-chiro-inositol 1-dehydrogenase
MDSHMAVRSVEPDVTFPPGEPHRTFAGRFSEAYRAEMAAFIELILGERKNPCPPEDAVAASRVAGAAQESLETGTPVAVPASPPAARPTAIFSGQLPNDIDRTY